MCPVGSFQLLMLFYNFVKKPWLIECATACHRRHAEGMDRAEDRHENVTSGSRKVIENFQNHIEHKYGNYSLTEST